MSVINVRMEIVLANYNVRTTQIILIVNSNVLNLSEKIPKFVLETGNVRRNAIQNVNPIGEVRKK